MKLETIVLATTFSVFTGKAQIHPRNCSQRTAEDYVSITRTERAEDYVRSLTGPQVFLYAAAQAGIDQGANRPREWQQGALGYGRRFGDNLAHSIIGNTLQHGFALGLGEDNRFFTSGARGFGRRLEYAVTSPLLARHANRSRSLSISALAGVAGASLIAQAWQPRSTARMANTVRSFGVTFAFRIGVDVFREFTPRVVGESIR
jgi:hypothetical protein